MPRSQGILHVIHKRIDRLSVTGADRSAAREPHAHDRARHPDTHRRCPLAYMRLGQSTAQPVLYRRGHGLKRVQDTVERRVQVVAGRGRSLCDRSGGGLRGHDRGRLCLTRGTGKR